jgi:RNA polymerase sigma factor (sigma-70 family)
MSTTRRRQSGSPPESNDDLRDELSQIYALMPACPSLSPAEQNAMISEYQETHDPRIADKIIATNAALVLQVISKSFRRYLRHFGWGLEYSDLFQAGSIGLMRAAKDYDPKKGAFSTHAVPWIRQKIQVELQYHAALVHIPIRAVRAGARSTFAPLDPPHDDVHTNGMTVMDYYIRGSDQTMPTTPRLQAELDELAQLLTQLPGILASIPHTSKEDVRIFTLRCGMDCPNNGLPQPRRSVAVAEMVGKSNSWVKEVCDKAWGKILRRYRNNPDQYTFLTAFRNRLRGARPGRSKDPKVTAST